MTETKNQQLTVKRGILAIVIMYACQLLAGIAISYGFKFFSPSNKVSLEILGLTSALLSGVMIITYFYWDIRRSGTHFNTEIGLQTSELSMRKGILMVSSVLILTHFFAWLYRSILLPSLGHEGIVGGGSKMFNFIYVNGGTLEMSGFLILALLVGPIMEELVFRGYLQSALTTKLPVWASILITSIVFTIGHSPVTLWPMYFLYSISWGWIFFRTGSIKIVVLIHILSNLFYAIVGFAKWNILA